MVQSIGKIRRSLDRWRVAIATSLDVAQPDRENLWIINQQVQSLLLRLLLLHGFDQQGRLPTALRSLPNHHLGNSLHALWEDCHERYGDWLSIKETTINTKNRTIIGWDLADQLLRSLLQEITIEFAEPLHPRDLGQLYEDCLGRPLQWVESHWQIAPQSPHRKNSGSYYTPVAIAQLMVHHTLDAWLADWQEKGDRPTVRILDPACGGGIFLLTAYQALLDWYQQRLGCGLTVSDRSQILQDHLFGIDCNPQAVEVSRLSLGWMQLWDCNQEPENPLPSLQENLQLGNALLDSPEQANSFLNLDNTLQSLAGETRFPALLRSPQFEVVIGNPPYLDSEAMTTQLPHWRRYCGDRYRSASGNWDLFCVFVERSLELCCPEGFVSLVVPNKLASAEYATATRSLLIQESQLLNLWDYSQLPVFAAAVYPLVYVARKQSPDASATVRYCSMQDLTTEGDRLELPYTRFLRSPNQPWRFLPTSRLEDRMNWIQEKFPLLGDIAQVVGAATVGEAYAIHPFIQEAGNPETRNHETTEQTGLKLVNSGTIDRYHLRWGEKQLRYLGDRFWRPIIPAKHFPQLPQKRLQQALHPKLILAGLSQKLECAADLSGTVIAGKSTSIIFSSVDLRYLLGLLNSRLLSYYLCDRFGGNRLRGGYLRIGPPQLRSLPIPHPDSLDEHGQLLSQQLIACVEERLRLTETRAAIASSLVQSRQTKLDQEIDSLVYRLYNLSEQEIEAITSNISKSTGERLGFL